MADARLVDRLWYGASVSARAARAALAPLEVAYRAVIAVRSALYDAGIVRQRALPLPAVSVGNLTVGGTGKTPVAAWIAAELAARGARPAIVMRGYGSDEPLVHQRLNPTIPVIACADRRVGAARAAAAGATVVVLDDAFQHRAAARDADVVLVSADRWRPWRRALPAGPWREPLGALRRATLAIVTRRAAPPDAAAAIADELGRVAPRVPVVIASLALGELRRLDAPETAPLEVLAGTPMLCVAAIGDPVALAAQLAQGGAVVRLRAFPDHHGFTDAEIAALARAAEGARVVCTLKDAVKLSPRWPRAAPPLWYVSQRVVIETDRQPLDVLLGRLLDARRDNPQLDAASPARHFSP